MIIWPRRRLVLIGLSLILVNRLAGLVIPGSSIYLLDNEIGAENYAIIKVIIIALYLIHI